MAIQKQLVHLNMKGGADTKHDDFLVIPSKVTVADGVGFGDDETLGVLNGATSFVSADAFVARRISALGKNLVLEGTVGAAPIIRRVNTLDTTKYADLNEVASTNDSPYRTEALLERLPSAPFPADAGGFAGAAGENSFVCASDVGVYGTAMLYAQQASDGAAAYIQIALLVSGVMQFSVAFGGGADALSNPRVIPLNGAGAGKFAVYYIRTTGGTKYLCVRVFDSTPAQLSAFGNPGPETVLTAGADTPGAQELMDAAAAVNSNTYHYVTHVNSAGDIRTLKVSAVDGVTITANTSLVPSAGVRTLSTLSIVLSGVTRSVAFFTVQDQFVKAASVRADTNVTTLETIVATCPNAASRIGRVTAVDTGTAIEVFYDACQGAAYGSLIVDVGKTEIRRGALSYALVPSSDNFVVTGVYILSRPIYISGRQLLPVYRSSVGECTAFLLDVFLYSSPVVVARLAYGEMTFQTQIRSAASPYWPFRIPSTVPSTDAETLEFPIPIFTGNVQVIAGVNRTQSGLARARIRMPSACVKMSAVPVQGGLALSAGCPLWVDNAECAEAGFNWRPKINALTAAGAAGNLSTGTVRFAATFAWVDHVGQWHESAPSDSVAVTAVAGNSYTITTSVLGLTRKNSVRILIYRTVVGGTTYYLDAVQMTNSKAEGVYEVTITGTVAAGAQSDAALSASGSELLPTTGGVLPNDPLPAHRQSCIFQNRLWMFGCGDGYDIYYTHPFDEGFGVEHSVLLYKRVPQQFGRAIGGAESYGKLVIVCENGVGFLYGAGPTRTGAQDNYSEIEFPVHSTANVWESPGAVVSTADGVWFLSDAGLRCFRDTGTVRTEAGVEVGSEMDQYVRSETNLKADIVGSQLRFVGATAMYIYDTHWGQWSRLPGMNVTDSTVIEGKHFFAYDNTVAVLQNPVDVAEVVAPVLDGAVTVFPAPSASIETPWLSLAGIQGFQRVLRLQALFRSVSGAVKYTNVYFDIAYDYGAYSEYASGSIEAATGQLQHHFARQKCEAVKIKVRWNPVNGYGLSGLFRLVDLTLQVGVKSGYYKLPASKRI